MIEIYEKTIKELIEKNNNLMAELRKERIEKRQLYKNIVSETRTKKEYGIIICSLYEIAMELNNFAKENTITNYTVCQVHQSHEHKDDYVITIEFKRKADF